MRAGVPENKRTYSSIWDNNAIGTGHARSVIGSPQGWSAKTNAAGQWVQMDLGAERLVAGTVIQPRVGNSQYVTQYTVTTSLDGKTWTSVAGTYTGHNSQLRENKFAGGALVRARYVRIVVGKWGNHISLRADVLVSAGDGNATSVPDMIGDENATSVSDMIGDGNATSVSDMIANGNTTVTTITLAGETGSD